ncbi:Uncharacterized protein FKW44_015902 [Caligus rogercresseyi]|uniref:Syndecan n=1 Tax=Caligus rogercresseyi TaxID=217165 RepID=A0A7T8K0Y9_CALRO|nr:Uncharacterized protein FKW44_015902 [Caligus rogercresseyi]
MGCCFLSIFPSFFIGNEDVPTQSTPSHTYYEGDEDDYSLHHSHNEEEEDDLATLIHPNRSVESSMLDHTTNFPQPTLFAIPGQLHEEEEDEVEEEGSDGKNLGYEGFDPNSEPADPPPVPTKTLPATMVLVIGIILGAFVAMILIVIIVLKMRTRVESAVKCESAEPPPAAPRYQFAPQMTTASWENRKRQRHRSLTGEMDSLTPVPSMGTALDSLGNQMALNLAKTNPFLEDVGRKEELKKSR